MLSLDYNTALTEDSRSIKNSYLPVAILDSISGVVELLRLTAIIFRLHRRFDQRLARKILTVKGITKEVFVCLEEQKEKDFSRAIKNINKHIAADIMFRGKFENMNPDSQTLKRIIQRTLDRFDLVIAAEYDLLRAYKRANKPTITPTSDLAKTVAKHSEKIISQILNAN